MASTTADRARTMLALLRHLEPDAEIPLEELARLVGSTPEQVAADVTTLSMCGVAPYDPLDLVSAFVDGGTVFVMGPPPALERPVRLSPTEARALATALQTAGFDAHAALTERLMEAASLEFSAEELEQRLRSTGPVHAEAVYAMLASASAEHDVVSIEYQRVGEGSSAAREIEPTALFNDRGVWYVSAYCRSAEGMRTFRLDRIKQAEMTGEEFESRPISAEDTSFSGEGLPTARLIFAIADAYSEREWPGSNLAADVAPEGSLAVDVPYAGCAWLARQVCARLGTVVVESPAEVREAVVSMAMQVTAELEEA